MLSPADDLPALQRQFARALSELAPLCGAAAESKVRHTLAGLGGQAAREGLSEQDIQRMIDED